MKILITTLLAATCVQAFAGDKIIYGADDRQDIRDVTDAALLDLASSTAAMIPTWKVGYYTDKVVIPAINDILSLKGSMGVCATERFATQPALADCSGFLVGEKTLVTAGHCVNEAEGCGDNVWVFDYKLDTPGVDTPMVRGSNIYKCAKVVKSVLDPVTKMDYAVVELDRAVTDRKPLTFRKEGAIEVNAPVVVIGHPSGLPTKVAGGARVMDINPVFFRGNLDTYGGNSGSAVFNAKTLEVEGILVRGARDYVAGPAGCAVSNVVAVDRATEAVTLITNVKEISGL